MPLQVGARLGPYEILSALGAGGMGEVYRARDAKLKRDVAVKVLPDLVASDPDRLARFHREAEVLAALNHPNIAAIYGFEDSNNAHALVMELVDGPTLADRISLGPIPLNEALPLAKQIAEALEAAHEQGIIHRDLKPTNIKVREDGMVKVLDFGLAKLVDPGAGNPRSNPSITASPTITTPAMMTGVGVILGTAAYMSPEQAKGRPADKRSDVWSFGCVLYEMLTAKRAFDGEDVSDTLAAVLRGEPHWSRLPARTPPALQTMLKRCVEKDRKQRIGDISAALFVLNELSFLATPPGSGQASNTRPQKLVAAALSAGVLIAALGSGLTWLAARRPDNSKSPLTRFSVALPGDQRLTSTNRHLVAISPDGTRLAYVANSQIYLRPFDQLDALPIRGTSEAPSELFFSPDGQWIGYYARNQLKKIAVTGGAPINICDTALPLGASWEENQIVWSQGASGIFHVSDAGGTPKVLVEADKKHGEVMHGPQLLPAENAVLFTLLSIGADNLTVGDSGFAGASRWDDAQIVVQSVKTGQRKVLVQGGTDARYLPSGHLVYARAGVIYARAFDANRLEFTGGPVAMLDGVAQVGSVNGNQASGSAQFAVSRTGSLVYMPGIASATRSLVWRDRQGRETPIAAPSRAYIIARVSPDSRRIALDANDQDYDIWSWDVDRETLTRLTFDKSQEQRPLWTTDGKRIIFESTKSGVLNLFWKPADGTGQSELLVQSPVTMRAHSLSPDGKELLGLQQQLQTGNDIVTVNVDGERKVRPLVQTPAAEQGAVVSRDGRWIAYESDESGAFQLYVRPFPKVEQGRWQVSTDGGTRALWAPNGRELYYVDGRGRVMIVNVQTSPSFSAGKPEVLFADAGAEPSPARSFDITPDGSRFVFVKDQQASTVTQFVVVEHWVEELNARVPTKR